MAFFRQGLATAERVTSVQEFKGNIRAIDSALRHTQPGDLLVIQADMGAERRREVGREKISQNARRETPWHPRVTDSTRLRE